LGEETAVGKHHACVLIAGGPIKCWGRNNHKQLGDGSSVTHASSPVQVLNIADATAIYAGDNHSCALVSGGAVKCWGDNYYGQLGDNSLNDASSPVTAMGISGATAITAGGGHSCALLDGGTMKCWGYNNYGQLGIGSNSSPIKTPVAVQQLSDAVMINAGGNGTCAVIANGDIKCWGWNNYGTLGIGNNTGQENCNSNPCSTLPVKVIGF